MCTEGSWADVVSMCWTAEYLDRFHQSQLTSARVLSTGQMSPVRSDKRKLALDKLMRDAWTHVRNRITLQWCWTTRERA